jgi:HlyD family secretion protein
VGKTVSVMRNGANDAIKAVITELRPLGTFATWQAERVVGIKTAARFACASTRSESRQALSRMTVWIDSLAGATARP